MPAASHGDRRAHSGHIHGRRRSRHGHPKIRYCIFDISAGGVLGGICSRPAVGPGSVRWMGPAGTGERGRAEENEQKRTSRRDEQKRQAEEKRPGRENGRAGRPGPAGQAAARRRRLREQVLRTAGAPGRAAAAAAGPGGGRGGQGAHRRVGVRSSSRALRPPRRLPRSSDDHPTMSGSFSQPRTVEVCASFAFSQSTSHSGKRLRSSSRAIRPSSRASAAPRQ